METDGLPIQRLARRLFWARIRLGGVGVVLAALVFVAAARKPPEAIVAHRVAIVDSRGKELVTMESAEDHVPVLRVFNAAHTQMLQVDPETLGFQERRSGPTVERVEFGIPHKSEAGFALVDAKRQGGLIATSKSYSDPKDPTLPGTLRFATPGAGIISLTAIEGEDGMGLHVDAKVVGEWACPSSDQKCAEMKAMQKKLRELGGPLGLVPEKQ